jgi:hypothetical protein
MAIKLLTPECLVADWCFAPAAYDVAIRRGSIRVACEKELKRIVGVAPNTSPEFSTALVAALSSKEKIKELKEVYGWVDKSSNGISMSLYCGPMEKRGGWLLTGDAPLGSIGRFAQWQAYYGPVLASVKYVMLPHHGAGGDYFNQGLLDIGQDTKVFFTAKEGDRKRPHRDVRLGLMFEKKANGKNAIRRLHRVGHRKTSAIQHICGGAFADQEDLEQAMQW